MTGYLALARKWRPKNFTTLLGQDLTVQALTNALSTGRLHHAYLFTGTRGVGKTSIARMFAKALNCEQGITPTPCQTCGTCLAIDAARCMDVIEIDAASKTRVEDTREMLENIQYATASARFKIYVIDEVHMLSTHSFNALLKTLEEPPAHVKFMLATTDPQKIPVTVLSRCLQFHLQTLPQQTIMQQLEMIAQAEHVPTEPEALHLLAEAAQGSMRDALSLYDQAIAVAGAEPVTQSLVKNLLGYTRQSYAIPLLEAILARDAQRITTLVDAILCEGGQYIHVHQSLLKILHRIALLQQLPESAPQRRAHPDLLPFVVSLSPEMVQLFYQIALKGGQDLLLAPAPALGFEMSMLRMMAFYPIPAVTPPCIPLLMEESSPEAEVSPLESAIPHTTGQATDAGSAIAAPRHQQRMVQEGTTVPASHAWHDCIAALALKGMALHAIKNTVLLEKSGRSVAVSVQKGYVALFTPAVKLQIEKALTKYYGTTIALILHETAEPLVETLAEQEKQQAEVSLQAAEHSILHDSFAQQLQQAFSAEIQPDSIRRLEDAI